MHTLACGPSSCYNPPVFKFTRNQVIAVCVIAGIALLGMVFHFMKANTGSGKGKVTFTEPQQAKNVQASIDVPPKPAQICIHVAGKVSKPGLYNLKPGSRVMDAIKAAGGQLPNADMESINLAEVLSDGQQIYIAPKGEITPPKRSVVRGGTAQAKGPHKSAEKEGKAALEKLKVPGKGTVNINSAGLDEFQRLPGIGPAYAQRIVDYRTEHGRFTSVEQLDNVTGIGPKTLEKLRPFVAL